MFTSGFEGAPDRDSYKKSAHPNPGDESPDISHTDPKATGKLLGYISAYEDLQVHAKRQIANPTPPSTVETWVGMLIETQRPPIDRPEKPITEYDRVLATARLKAIEEMRQRPIDVPTNMAGREQFDQDLKRLEVQPEPHSKPKEVDPQETNEFTSAMPPQEGWPTSG